MPDQFDKAEQLIMDRFPALRKIRDHEQVIELHKLVQMVAGSLFAGSRDVPFAGARVNFIDRDSGQQRAVFYPLTRIELLNVHNDQMPTTYRAFRVDESGWQEEQ